MCGINAILTSDSQGNRSESLISLNHRGPDQTCHWSLDEISVDYYRLAITGGDSGQAPVTSEDSRWTCFLNGEIYNFRELSAMHLERVYSSDTKVLVEGIAKYGLTFFNFVFGMFAGVLVDNVSRRIFVFRDFFGEKPLYFAFEDKQMFISSEFKVLSEKLRGSLEIDLDAIYDYFKFGYVEEPKTIDLRIKAFPKGAVVSIDARQKNIVTEHVLNPLVIQETDLSDLIENVVCQVTSSDVKQGYLLSGGFDSSTLLKFSRKRNIAEDEAFTLRGVGDSNLQDVMGAKKIAKVLGIKHNIVAISETEVLHRLPELVNSLDQPHSDMSSFGYFRLFEAIKESGLKVAQVGHGVDEMFWGYEWFNRRVSSTDSNDKDRIFLSTPSDQTELLDEKFIFSKSKTRENLHPSDPYLKSISRYQRARAEICHSYLSHNGLSQIDRLAMHHGVEPRAAFSDMRLYAWAQENCHGAADFGKLAFRSAVSSPMQRVFSRKKKRGFDIGMMQYVNSREFEKMYGRRLFEFGGLILPLNHELAQMKLGARQRYRLLILSLWLESNQ